MTLADRVLPSRRRRARQRRRARSFAFERRLAELEEQVDGLRTVLDSLDEGVVAVDRTGIVHQANSTAHDLLGMDPDRSLGHHMYAAIPSEDVCDALEQQLRDVAPRHGHDREVMLRPPLGDPVLVTIKVRRLGDGDAASRAGADGALVVLRDVTELRRLERARADFFVNASHELKTPVAAVQGLVETMIDDDSMPAETRISFLEKARRQCLRLSSLVADILSLSQVESASPDEPRHALPVVQLVRQAAATCFDSAEQAGITIHLPASAGTGVHSVLGTAEALRMAVGNLVANAVSHSKAGDSVSVGVTGADGWVEISVRDEGEGIAAEHLPRIFERFYRVDEARSRERGGTGIGLSIVRHVARAHGGDVEVESVLGAGSTFTLRLPASSGLTTQHREVGTPREL